MPECKQHKETISSACGCSNHCNQHTCTCMHVHVCVHVCMQVCVYVCLVCIRLHVLNVPHLCKSGNSFDRDWRSQEKVNKYSNAWTEAEVAKKKEMYAYSIIIVWRLYILHWLKICPTLADSPGDVFSMKSHEKRVWIKDNWFVFAITAVPKPFVPRTPCALKYFSRSPWLFWLSRCYGKLLWKFVMANCFKINKLFKKPKRTLEKKILCYITQYYYFLHWRGLFFVWRMSMHAFVKHLLRWRKSPLLKQWFSHIYCRLLGTIWAYA